jgi:bifunctional DNase/RNase
MGLFKRGKDKDEESERSNELESDMSTEKNPNLVEMTVDSIRAVQVTTDTLRASDAYRHVLVLKELKGERYLPILIGPSEAESIAVRIEGSPVPRPLTHDFIIAIIDLMEGSIENVIISELKNDCWYARTVLNCNGQLAEIDCRPSDAVAVAVRAEVPIYTTEEILKKASTKNI